MARTPSADALATKRLMSTVGGEGIQNFSMVRTAVGAERYGPVWDGESIFEFGGRFRVTGEEAGCECIVGGGESVDGDIPATVSEEGVDV